MQPIHSLPLANHCHCHNGHQNSCCCNMYCSQRFESKRNDFKQKLNSLVDELFDFFRNEFGHSATGPCFCRAAPAAYQANAGFPSFSNPCQGWQPPPPPPPPPPVPSDIALSSELSQQYVPVASSSTNTLISGVNQQASQARSTEAIGVHDVDCECSNCLQSIEQFLNSIQQENLHAENGDKESDNRDHNSVPMEEDTEEGEEEAGNNAVDSTQNDNSTIVNLPLQVNLHLKCTDAKCGVMFETAEQLEHHLAEYHRNASSSLSPPNQQEGSSAYRSKQQTPNSVPPQSQFTCDYCPKQFRSQASLYQHERDFHQPGDYPCNFPKDKESRCTFRAPYRHMLHKHRNLKKHWNYNLANQHLKSTNAPSTSTKATARKPIYVCKWSPDQCGYSSTQKARVIYHIIEHLEQHNREEASPAIHTTERSALQYLEERQQ